MHLQFQNVCNEDQIGGAKTTSPFSYLKLHQENQVRKKKPGTRKNPFTKDTNFSSFPKERQSSNICITTASIKIEHRIVSFSEILMRERMENREETQAKSEESQSRTKINCPTQPNKPLSHKEEQGSKKMLNDTIAYLDEKDGTGSEETSQD